MFTYGWLILMIEGTERKTVSLIETAYIDGEVAS